MLLGVLMLEKEFSKNLRIDKNNGIHIFYSYIKVGIKKWVIMGKIEIGFNSHLPRNYREYKLCRNFFIMDACRRFKYA
jgi:hypothetical protein